MASKTSGVSKVNRGDIGGDSFYVTNVTTLADGSVQRETYRSDNKGNNKVLIQSVTVNSEGTVTKDELTSNATVNEQRDLKNPKSNLRQVIKNQVNNVTPDLKGDGNIDIEITKYALKALNVDKFGLDEMDNKILTTLIKKFNGQPVGINTLSTAVSETAETIEEVYEPFLIQEGFLLRTPRGRQVTKKAYKHLDIEVSNSQKDLFD